MSAWYIFSAMGFYPVNPVSGEYVVGSYVFSLAGRLDMLTKCFTIVPSSNLST